VPDGRGWYVESGSDQAATLRLADERDAYALADLPTFARIAALRLRVLLTNDTLLRNVYTMYVLRGAPVAAREFADTALGAWRARLLNLRLPPRDIPAFEGVRDSCTVLP
jgi:ABC-type tungstate transport system permease subunit